VSAVLLDTNILSEAMKPQPHAGVIGWLRTAQDAYLSVITLHELEYGIALLPAGKRRSELEAMIAALLAEYDDRIVPISGREARAAAELRLVARRQGRVLHLADALIGATAMANDLTLATRNVGDFADLGVRLIDPWQTDPSAGAR
jgi:predicted nucleic acid-binding protein